MIRRERIEELVREGDLDVAFAAAVELRRAEPHVDQHAELLFSVVEAADRANHALDPQPLEDVRRALEASVGGVLHLRPAERALFEPWAVLATRLAGSDLAEHSENASRACTLASTFLRRAGRYREALVMANVAYRRASHEPADALRKALALHALGSFDDAAAAYEEILGADPGRALFGAACARFDQGDYAKALALFTDARVGAHKPRDVTIGAGVCRRKLGIAETNPRIVELVDIAFADLPSTFDEIRRFSLMNDGTTIAMTDESTMALLALAPGERMKTASAHEVECPSMIMTLSLAMRDSSVIDDELAYAAPPPPPGYARPAHADGVDLWALTASGRLPTQRQPPQLDLVVRIVAMLEDSPGRMSALVERAQSGAYDDVAPREIMDAMVGIPGDPDVGVTIGAELVGNVFGWQRTCAFALAFQKHAEPWAQSQRRASLRALVLGPSDWTTAAALIALTEVLLDDVAVLNDARAWLDILVENAPSARHCPWAAALEHLVNRVPMFRRDLLARFEAQLAKPLAS